MANESFAMTCLSAPFMHKSLNQSTPCPAEIGGEVVAPATDVVAEARPDIGHRRPTRGLFNAFRSGGTLCAKKLMTFC